MSIVEYDDNAAHCSACKCIGHFQSIKTDVWLNFLKTTNTIRIG